MLPLLLVFRSFPGDLGGWRTKCDSSSFSFAYNGTLIRAMLAEVSVVSGTAVTEDEREIVGPSSASKMLGLSDGLPIRKEFSWHELCSPFTVSS